MAEFPDVKTMDEVKAAFAADTTIPPKYKTDARVSYSVGGYVVVAGGVTFVAMREMGRWHFRKGPLHR